MAHIKPRAMIRNPRFLAPYDKTLWSSPGQLWPVMSMEKRDIPNNAPKTPVWPTRRSCCLPSCLPHPLGGFPLCSPLMEVFLPFPSAGKASQNASPRCAGGLREGPEYGSATATPSRRRVASVSQSIDGQVRGKVINGHGMVCGPRAGRLRPFRPELSFLSKLNPTVMVNFGTSSSGHGGTKCFFTPVLLLLQSLATEFETVLRIDVLT